MSYTASYFHVVFGTKKRKPSLSLLHKEELRRYIYGIAKNMKCDIECLNMMSEHVHILVDLNPSVSLSKFVGTVKQSSSLWLKNNIRFAMFDGWSKEYYGVSVSPSNKDSVKSYINNQELHHASQGFDSEIRWLVETTGMRFFDGSFD